MLTLRVGDGKTQRHALIASVSIIQKKQKTGELFSFSFFHPNVYKS
jgi:hypothetical protein